MLAEYAGAVFHGIPAEALADALAPLERRSYAAGDTLISEGDPDQTEMFVIETGFADVFVNDRHGRETLVGTDGPGAALGEMALFTGQPASATVRASVALAVLVLRSEDLHRIAAAHPRVYRNLGAGLSERLALSNHRVANAGSGRVTLLVDEGAPPLLAYALCCSVAWHTRRPALLLVIAERVPAELEALGVLCDAASIVRSAGQQRAAGATLAIARPVGPFSPPELPGTLQELCDSFDQVLVDTGGDLRAPRPGEYVVHLVPQHRRAGRWEGRSGHIVRAWAAEPGHPRPDRDGVLSVPVLAGADAASLRRGLLPATSAAGQALGWLARDLAELKVGLALGSGAMRGYAHFGVLRVLEAAGVPVDYIAGTSIGAAVAALYASGFNSAQALAAMDDVGSQAFRPTLSTNALLSSSGLRAGLRRVAGNARMEELPTPLAIVAVDILQRREIVFKRGLIWPAVLASMSIPGIYPPLRMGGLTLVDGGVLNPVPASVVAGMGANRIIGVTLATRPAPHGAAPTTAPGAGRSPSVLQAITRTIELMQSKIGATTAASAEVLIEPIFSPDEGWGLRNFRLGRRLIPAGEAAARVALPQLTEALPWLQHAGGVA